MDRYFWRWIEFGGEGKVKVVEYEMLSVMALDGVKLLRKEFEDFKKQLNNK